MDLLQATKLILNGEDVGGLFVGPTFAWPDPWTDIWIEEGPPVP